MNATRVSLGTIGKCIYCGGSETNLSEEHILPFALGGIWTLKQASCERCRDITSGFELDVLHNTLLPVRAKMNLPTRRKNKRPSVFPVTYESGNQQKTVNLPLAKRHTSLILSIFKQPAYVDMRKYEKGIEITGTVAYTFSKSSLEEFMLEHNANSISETVTFKAKDGFSFARLLAKIAYGFAVAHFGINILNNNYIISSILGKLDDSGKWVGSNNLVPSSRQNLHEIELSIEKNDIYIKIRLFTNFGPSIPEYLVIVGRAPQVPSITPSQIQFHC